MLVEEESVWTEARSQTMVSEVQILHDRPRVSPEPSFSFQYHVFNTIFHSLLSLISAIQALGKVDLNQGMPNLKMVNDLKVMQHGFVKTMIVNTY